VSGDDGLHPSRIAERRPAHIDDQHRRAEAGRRYQRPVDLIGVCHIDLGGHRDRRLPADPAHS
jgi:hypothetical protein